jgi:tRNA modification GTPase
MSFKEDNKTIAALATGKGKSALAVIRISGIDAFKIVAKCLNPEKRFNNARPKSIHLYYLINSKTKKNIDEITAIKYVSPKSYTGENMVEIICHGNELIIDEIFSILFNNGIRFAKKGEFTRRAYLNGKIDLLKAESINQIIESSNKIQYKNAMEMFSGNNKHILLKWKKEILDILIEIDAEIEFPEEDDIIHKKKEYLKKIEYLSKIIREEIVKREKIKIIESGLIVPIIGIANAGKSSLFNLIIGFNRVIVHHEAGTTRDAISEEILIGDEKTKIIDTAGLNDSKNIVEILGIEKSWQYIKNSHLIIWVTPSDQEINKTEEKMLKEIDSQRTIAIISKNDLNTDKKKKNILEKIKIPYIETCLIKDDSKEKNKIINFLSQHIKKITDVNNAEPGIICNKRHEEIFIRINKKMNAILERAETNFEEILSYELKGILADLEEFIGETINDEILNSIFSEFCIGK